MKKNSSEYINSLVKRASLGDKDAINYLIKHYKKLVLNIVSSFDIKEEDKEDLLQEGYSAILSSIYSYSFKTLNFNSYVKKNIIKRIKIFVKQSNYKNDDVIKLNEEDIYSSVDSLIDGSSSLNGSVVSDGEIVSLDETISSNDMSVENKVFLNCLKNDLREFLKRTNLTPFEKKVLEYRYGFYGCYYTLDQIGDIEGVSHQCIAEAEKVALDKLRWLSTVKKFALYMDKPEEAMTYIDEFQGHKKEDNKAWQINLHNFFDLMNFKSEEEKKLCNKILYYLPRREKAFLTTIFGSLYLRQVNMENILNRDKEHIEEIIKLIKEIQHEIIGNIKWQNHENVLRFYVRTRFAKRLTDDCDNLAYYFDYAYTDKQLISAIDKLDSKYQSILYNKCYAKNVNDILYFNYSDKERLDDAIFCLKEKLLEMYPGIYSSTNIDMLVKLLLISTNIRGITAIDALDKDLFFETYGKPLNFEEIMALSYLTRKGVVKMSLKEMANFMGITAEDLDDMINSALQKCNVYVTTKDYGTTNPNSAKKIL